MEEFATNDQSILLILGDRHYIMFNGKRAYELKGKFLDDLHDNAFSGTNGEDANNGQEGVDDEEFSDVEKANNDDEQETAEIFRIETNLFDYETPPWSEDGVPYDMCDHIYKPFRFKNGKAKWPTCNSNEDGFCNGGELPGMVRIGYMTYFHDYEWYDELADMNLKEEALKQKAIYETSWGDESQSVMNLCAWLKKSFGNIHELDYELLIKLEDYWWKEMNR
ncbi:hypothetical protein Tco_1417350 [Tanacetum coccineum]